MVTFGIATDQHLFGQRHEFAGGNGVRTFGGTGGGKGPARTALALVFNGSDGILFAPVNGSGRGLFDGLRRQGVVDVFAAAQVFVGVFDTGVDFGKFFPGHVGEFVVAGFHRVVGQVELLDEGIVGRPRGVGGVDLSIGVLFVEQFDPGFKTGADFDLGKKWRGGGKRDTGEWFGL